MGRLLAYFSLYHSLNLCMGKIVLSRVSRRISLFKIELQPFIVSLDVFIDIGNKFAVAVLQSSCPCVQNLGQMLENIFRSMCYMLRGPIQRIEASHQTFRFIHAGDETGVAASRALEWPVELCCYKHLTIPNILDQETSVEQLMESPQYLFSSRHLMRSTTAWQVERE